ncbi:hypothetical protein [Pseudonocardia sp. TRM90224]|uniref:hypothetical protein n=1 Tax=Pseudonocardia sp. TRM90224 TaxID=2812678 RepID=UPI001E52B00A|nr:hypothetical protein [Pseudonocardia sp. TRM90224]
MNLLAKLSDRMLDVLVHKTTAAAWNQQGCSTECRHEAACGPAYWMECRYCGGGRPSCRCNALCNPG